MIKIVICGANGKMGQHVASAAAKSTNICVTCGVDLYPDTVKNDFPVYKYIEECDAPFDVIIDFSLPEALESNLAFAIKRKAAIVIATTGFTDDDKAKINEAATKTPVFFAANMSLGVNLQMALAKTAAAFLGEAYDIEIIEKHHNQKVDAPSGTALAIAEHINTAFDEQKEFVYGRHSKSEKRGREIGIHGVRGGTIVGEHTVLFAGTDEIIEIKHTAQSKQLFAHGALKAAEFLVGRPAGLYGMNDMLI
jgi:4-hydroxy-tetrahydrodipicolinate reductase